MNEEQAATANPAYPTLDAVVTETGRFLKSMGKAMITTVQDMSDLMIVKVDKDIRERLDSLVEIGIVENRREAAKSLIADGLKNRTSIFNKIDETKAKITELRQQIHEVAQEQG